ncbi:flagellin FliC [Halomonas litopenaei]|uniref:Flagellin n=1 Tax=Halomonas litopenaei TaxID=2109328 RepID=A0ABX5IZE7_9GAMM|nr:MULTISPECIES: flagellin [Halomonas]PTL91308.1 flagellin FliC [Halomonas sp. SYSU XM8]PTL95216.1 flagellin FliC [Halomonas litopenaei]
MSVINTNITSMIGQQNLNASKSALTTSMERLSSGLRINSAKDDAAGQAIANRMSSQITGLSQAQRNANDGISVAQTTEGALNQINDNLQRVRELTVQAQNGTNSEEDLTSIQNEIGQRLNEINRISEETSFNGVKVLQEDTGLKIQVGANDSETISIDLKKINAETLGLENFSVSETKIEFSDSIAKKSDVSNVTNVAVGNDTAFDTNGTNYSAAPLANDAATKSYFDDATGITATDTGDKTSVVTGTDKAVYSVKIDGGDYFVAQDDDGSNKIQLLKQDGTGGYEKVQVENDSGTLTDVQVAVFNGKATAFIDDGSGNAQKVDLTGGIAKAEATELLAKNDSNLAVNIDGQNHNVHEILDKNGDASGKYGVRMEDGTVYAVAVDATSGNVSIQEDGDGNKVQYALQTDGDVATVVEHEGDLYGATLNATYNGTATRGATKFDTDLLQETGTAKPLEALDSALGEVDALRSDLGAIQNRFESAITNLSTTETNLSAARSRIEDADYATEVANMTRAQILQQAGTSVLAQANQVPQSVLSLLG